LGRWSGSHPQDHEHEPQQEALLHDTPHLALAAADSPWIPTKVVDSRGLASSPGLRREFVAHRTHGETGRYKWLRPIHGSMIGHAICTGCRIARRCRIPAVRVRSTIKLQEASMRPSLWPVSPRGEVSCGCGRLRSR